MANITIRNLDDDQKLRVRAAEHGRSMEEARAVLRRLVRQRPTNLGQAIHAWRRFGVRKASRDATHARP